MTGLESFEQISKYDFQNRSLRTSAILDSSKLLFDVENQFGSDYLGTLSCLRYETVKKYTLLVHINPGNTSSTVSENKKEKSHRSIYGLCNVNFFTCYISTVRLPNLMLGRIQSKQSFWHARFVGCDACVTNIVA